MEELVAPLVSINFAKIAWSSTTKMMMADSTISSAECVSFAHAKIASAKIVTVHPQHACVSPMRYQQPRSREEA